MRWWRLEAMRCAPGSLFCVLVAAGLTVRAAPAAADASPHLLENGSYRDAGSGAEAGVLNLRMYELERSRNYIEAIPVAERYAEVIKIQDGARNLAYVATLNHLAVLYRKTQREADAVAAHRRALSVLEELAAAEPDNAQWLRELAKCRISLAKSGDDPERNYKEALASLRKLETAGKLERFEGQWIGAVESNLRKLEIDRHFDAGKFEDALAVVEKEAQLREQDQASGQGSLRGTAEALDSVARYALFAHRPERALQASEKAIALAPNLVWMTLNRAHALLFLDRKEEALAAYREHEGEHLNGKGDWTTLIGRDFRDFRARGLDHPGFMEVERLLKIGPQRVAKVQLGRIIPCIGSSDMIGLARCDLENAQSQYGENHADYARALVRLATALDERKQSAEAAALYRRSIEILAKALPPDHPYVGQLLLRLDDKASTERGMRILASALRTEALARQIDPDDAYVASALQELADQSARAGRADEAARARKILSQREGPLLTNAAINQDTAGNSLARILSSYAKTLGEDPFSGSFASPGDSAYKSQYAYYNAVVTYYQAQGEAAAASAFRTQFIALSERMLREAEPNKAEVSDILVSLSELYDAAKRTRDAEDALRRAMAVRVSLQGPDGPEVARIQARLAKYNKK